MSQHEFTHAELAVPEILVLVAQHLQGLSPNRARLSVMAHDSDPTPLADIDHPFKVADEGDREHSCANRVSGRRLIQALWTPCSIVERKQH